MLYFDAALNIFFCSQFLIILKKCPCVGPLSRIKMSYFLLSTWTEELISTPKIITFLPNPSLGNEKDVFVSNPIPYPGYLYLPILAPFY